MAIEAGARIGPYQVLSLLGAGGMGEVYRARDTALNRDVALKVLPDLFARTPSASRASPAKPRPSRRSTIRTSRTSTGSKQSGGVRALVMELVEGEDLSQRIARGPVPLDEALPIAR